MSLLLFFSLAVFANTLANRYWVLRAGEPDWRLDRLGRRFQALLVIGFGQSRLLYERGPGWMHASIFFGFLVVLVYAQVIGQKDLWQAVMGDPTANQLSAAARTK